MTSSASNVSSLARRLRLLPDVQPPTKIANAPEDLLLLLGKQVVAPIDQRAHRLLARQRGAAAAGQHAKTLVEFLRQLSGRENLYPRRRQLDRQRDAVEPPADLRDDRRALVGQLELRSPMPSLAARTTRSRHTRARRSAVSESPACGTASDGTR